MLAIQNHRFRDEDQEVVLTLPIQFEIPSRLFTLSQSDFANVLLSASKILEFQKQTAFESVQSDYLKEQLDLKMKSKEEEFQTLKRQTDRLLRQKEEDLRSLTLDYEKLRAELETIRDTSSSLSEKRVEDIRSSKDGHIRDLKELLGSKDKKIQELETQLHEKQLAAGVSQKKGTMGEMFFQDLAMKTMGWNLSLISKDAHTTDLKYSSNGLQALFEVKNYSQEVKHEQYKKFLNDMNQHTEADIGFYISLKTSIPYYDDLTVEWTAAHQMLVIVPNFQSFDHQLLFHQFSLYMEVARKVRYLARISQTDGSSTEKIERATTYVQNMLKRIDKNKKEYDVLRKQLQASVDTMRGHIEGFFEAQLKEMHSTLAILGDDERMDAAPTEIPETLPNLAAEKKRRKPKKTEG